MAERPKPPIEIKHFEHDNIPSGGAFEQTWTPDKDYKIKYILFKRKDGIALTSSTVTISINDVPITRDKALLNTFGSDMLNALELNLELRKGWTLRYSGSNNEGETISLVVEIILEPL